MQKHDTSNIERQRNVLSKALINKSGAARYVVGEENRRVEELLDERYVDHYARESRLASLGRSLLIKVGLRQPKLPELIERPYLENSQQNEAVAEELDRSREHIRNNIMEGIDDVAVDNRLGLRTKDCILPPLFQQLHHRSENEAGSEITFLKWMTDHATNEQLINVWQWHDKYLSDLDNDPAFQERVSAIKTGYTEGSKQVIDDGTLHPDMAIQESAMQSIRVVHGSPFSPNLAVADAYVDRQLSVVQMREGVNDFALYHEITHLLNSGMHFEFDEGITDLIAAEIYNRSHSGEDRIDPRSSVYADQIATLDAFDRMSDGKVGLYELSRVYSGPDYSTNTFLFTEQVDAAVGLPITIPMLKSSRALINKGRAIHNGGVLSLASQLVMRHQAEFLAEMMFDDEGNRVARTAQELAARMLSKEVISKYGPDVIFEGLNILSEASKLEGKGLPE